MATAPRRPQIARRSKRRPTQRQDDPQIDPVEEALLESFPASDPPSPTTPIRHIGGPPRPGATTTKRDRK